MSLVIQPATIVEIGADWYLQKSLSSGATCARRLGAVKPREMGPLGGGEMSSDRTPCRQRMRQSRTELFGPGKAGPAV